MRAWGKHEQCVSYWVIALLGERLKYDRSHICNVRKNMGKRMLAVGTNVPVKNPDRGSKLHIHYGNAMM